MYNFNLSYSGLDNKIMLKLSQSFKLKIVNSKSANYRLDTAKPILKNAVNLFLFLNIFPSEKQNVSFTGL